MIMPSASGRYTTAKGKSLTNTRRVFSLAGEPEYGNAKARAVASSMAAEKRAPSPDSLFVVIHDLSQKFDPCRLDETCTLHRVRRRASANTSSAA